MYMPICFTCLSTSLFYHYFVSIIPLLIVAICLNNIPSPFIYNCLFYSFFGDVVSFEFSSTSPPLVYVQYAKRSQAELAKSRLGEGNTAESNGGESSTPVAAGSTSADSPYSYASFLSFLNKLSPSLAHCLPLQVSWSDSSSLANCLHISFDPIFASTLVSSSTASPIFSEEVVKTFFSQFGSVERVVLPLTEKGEFKGFGDVFFSNNETGQKVCYC